jgi:drug/metabolite transporter (DMT)-like permease
MPRSPIAVGVLLAATAAIAFGVTTPVVAWAGRGLGATTTAALLYLGAGGAALALRALRGRSDAPLRRGDAGRLLAIALLGGAVAPTLLAWGLQRAGATLGSLLLNLEAVFTIALARVGLAVAAIVAGGAALTVDAWRSAGWELAGALAVAGATAAWALDNTLTRPLAERDPLEVVLAKGLLGALATGALALALGEPRPTLVAALSLLGCGATGYGLSLRLYLLAQRRIGAARTGSVFAVAPFIGAALAFALGDRDAGLWTAIAAALFAIGVALHVTEDHGHDHVHDEETHDHVHRHDDGHHGHHHDPPVVGEHAHPHHHTPVVHHHAHAPDLHHQHEH